MFELKEFILIDQDYLRETREHIHRYPELGFDVDNTANFIANKLELLGLKVTRNIGNNFLNIMLSLCL